MYLAFRQQQQEQNKQQEQQQVFFTRTEDEQKHNYIRWTATRTATKFEVGSK